MEDPLSIFATTWEYLSRYPQEKERLQPFVDFLETTSPTHFTTRENLVGHVTTSGFLISEPGDKILLIHHLKLGRYLQPGGHVENDATLLASALREIHEEVGLGGDEIIFRQPDDIPIDIDPHRIPQRGNQPEHWHFDFRYLFTVKQSTGAPLTHQVEEVARPAWFDWHSRELLELLPAHVIARLRSHL